MGISIYNFNPSQQLTTEASGSDFISRKYQFYKMAPSATTTTTTTTEEHPTLTLRPEGLERIVIDGNNRRYGDWRDDLVRDGYAVVKGAIPRERALSYANRMYGLIESL